MKKQDPAVVVRKKDMKNLSARAPADPNIDWYVEDASRLYERVFARVRTVKSSQIARRWELFTYKQAYDSTFGPANTGALFTPGSRNPSSGFYGVSCNVIQSMVDTACARIAKEKPRPFVLPKEGSASLKRRAKRKQRYLDGAMAQAAVYHNMDDVFRDACVYGDGAILIYAEDGKFCSQVIKVDELVVDWVDGMYDSPTEMHWTHPEPRRKLLQQYPEHAAAIELARTSWRGEMSFMSKADMVEVCRSWKLPSTADSGDGRYAVSIPTATLSSEEYDKDYVPIVRFHWRAPTYGPHGMGIARACMGYQRAISDLLRGVLKSARMFAVPRIWVSKMSNVGTMGIGNEISVNTYTGEKPVFDTPPAASPDIYQFLQWLIDSAYKQEGLSQLSAQSEKPAGLNSGLALRTYQDVETQRFAIVGQRWERAYMAIARILLDLASENEIAVRARGRSSITSLEWKDVAMKEDEYAVEVWPTSLLPSQPEGALQSAQDLITSGLMPRDVAISQLQMPVLSGWFDEETAARDDIEMLISSIVEDGVYIEPDAVGDMQLCVKLAQSAYLRARADKTEPHTCDLLMQFLQRAVQLAQPAQPAAPIAAPAPGPGPGAPAAVAGQAPAPPPAPLAPQGAGAVPMAGPT